MTHLLNPSQRTSVTIVLRTLEENLRQAENWLAGAEESGILYHRKLNLPPERRVLAGQSIAAALGEIAKLAAALELSPEEEDPGRTIWGQMNILWTDLNDNSSSKLRRFGPVDPQLAQILDRSMSRLTALAGEIIRSIDPNQKPGEEPAQE